MARKSTLPGAGQRVCRAGLEGTRTPGWDVSSNNRSFLQINQEFGGSQDGMLTTTNDQTITNACNQGPPRRTGEPDTQGRPEQDTPGLVSEHPCGLVLRLIKTRTDTEKTAYARVRGKHVFLGPRDPPATAMQRQQSTPGPRPRLQNAIPGARSRDSRDV